MFRKVLRRKRYWRSRKTDGIVYLNHDKKCGGIYVTLEPGQAIVRVKDQDMVKVFTSAKKLEEFLDELKPEEII
ncbi:MAG: hypothetical protein ACQXXF_08785 [Thermoplasmatota archaeon]|jgi:hypothetical protein